MVTCVRATNRQIVDRRVAVWPDTTWNSGRREAIVLTCTAGVIEKTARTSRERRSRFVTLRSALRKPPWSSAAYRKRSVRCTIIGFRNTTKPGRPCVRPQGPRSSTTHTARSRESVAHQKQFVKHQRGMGAILPAPVTVRSPHVATDFHDTFHNMILDSQRSSDYPLCQHVLSSWICLDRFLLEIQR